MLRFHWGPTCYELVSNVKADKALGCLHCLQFRRGQRNEMEVRHLGGTPDGLIGLYFAGTTYPAADAPIAR